MRTPTYVSVMDTVPAKWDTFFLKPDNEFVRLNENCQGIIDPGKSSIWCFRLYLEWCHYGGSAFWNVSREFLWIILSMEYFFEAHPNDSIWLVFSILFKGQITAIMVYNGLSLTSIFLDSLNYIHVLLWRIYHRFKIYKNIFCTGDVLFMNFYCGGSLLISQIKTC